MKTEVYKMKDITGQDVYIPVDELLDVVHGNEYQIFGVTGEAILALRRRMDESAIELLEET